MGDVVSTGFKTEHQAQEILTLTWIAPVPRLTITEPPFDKICIFLFY